MFVLQDNDLKCTDFNDAPPVSRTINNNLNNEIFEENQ
jgi:hypothetical protein